MTTRLLPVEEWHKLAGTELETVVPHLTPERVSIIVVEDGGQVVGCWALMTVLHCEGLYIAPAYRGKGSVARRLWTTMRGLARDFGARSVATSACSDEVRALLAHVGAVRVPGESYVMQIGGK